MPSQINSFLKEHIFAISSEKELNDSFRPKDQKKLILPEKIQFPLNVRSYYTWKEPSGTYTYLVFKMPTWDIPRGVVFKRTPPGAEPVGGMCNWCHAYGTSEEIGLLSVAMSSQVSYSYMLCHDLSCIEKIEDACTLSGKNPEKYIVDLYFRMEKLFENISNFRRD